MISWILLIGCVASGQVSQDGVSPAQFLRLVDAATEPIRDVGLVCEGTMRLVGRQLVGASDDVLPDLHYQGLFLYRSDASVFQDTYIRGDRIDFPFTRYRVALLRDRLETLSLTPDSRRPPKRVRSQKGSAAALPETGSPTRFFYYWFYRWLATLSEFTVKHEGWEEVGGRRCWKILIDHLPSNTRPTKRLYRLWIDLERGGHPLQIDMLTGGELAMRTNAIQLAAFPLPDGKEAWLPVSATTNTFRWDGKSYDQPIFQEAYTVVLGSVRINQGIKDSRFTVLQNESPEAGRLLDPARKEFERASALAIAQRPKTDRKSVEETLNRKLEEARRQSRLIEASSAARGGSVVLPFVQLAAIVAGAGLIGIAVVKHRNRR
jgi:hypothetical protein